MAFLQKLSRRLSCHSCSFSSFEQHTSAMEVIKSKRLTFLGPPGAGKGTYSSWLRRKYGFGVISTGDLIRNIIRGEAQLSSSAPMDLLKHCVSTGELVPDNVIDDILDEAFFSKLEKNQGFILDGYPRTLKQAEKLQRGPHSIHLAVHFIVPDSVLLRKLSARRVCAGCGYSYNLCNIHENGIIMPPILPKVEGRCDHCEGGLIQRPDDREDVITRRLKIHHDTCDGLVDFYKSKDLYVSMDARGSLEDRLAHLEGVLAKQGQK
eukprot:TRINITY_DN8042_c0_g1_i1.p1 TRINITY_DN8042_c0_g1~~TRINITY_DN8042_c0_g1_i1.p1  ORF type:complete len:264 (+),score=51.69 TRINITY_DN8042_c0_g1_i1:66-857(+)